MSHPISNAPPEPNPEHTVLTSSGNNKSETVDSSRRRLGVGLGVSAIFTLASRPVLAGQHCLSSSAAFSGNLSHHGNLPICSAQKPADLLAGSSTSSVSNALTLKFNDTFQNGPNVNWKGKTIKDVLQAADNGNSGKRPNPISKEFAATLLSIRNGRIPSNVLDEVKLISMWNDWLTDGIFNPTAGAKWNANQIVTYLRSLQS